MSAEMVLGGHCLAVAERRPLLGGKGALSGSRPTRGEFGGIWP